MNKEEMIVMLKTLSQINTKGEDTIMMANCLQLLKKRITKAYEKQAEKERQEAEKEKELPKVDGKDVGFK